MGPTHDRGATYETSAYRERIKSVTVVPSAAEMAKKPRLISTPLAAILMIWRNRLLIRRLVNRELAAKWRGTMLGIVWSLATPLLTFAVYSFAFGEIFRGRWSGDLAGGNYSLILFSGVVTFSIFSETINRAPGLVLENVSYVKKVIFPLEILPVVAVSVSLVNALFGFAILLIAQLFITGHLPWSVLLVPVVLFPYCLIILGLSWLLASLGVFIRDMRQLVSVLTALLMFMTPIFYATSSVPVKFRWVIESNPLTPTLDQMRQVLFGSGLPDPKSYALSCAFALLFTAIGYFWFMRTRKAFADVL